MFLLYSLSLSPWRVLDTSECWADRDSCAAGHCDTAGSGVLVPSPSGWRVASEDMGMELGRLSDPSGGRDGSGFNFPPSQLRDGDPRSRSDRHVAERLPSSLGHLGFCG